MESGTNWCYCKTTNQTNSPGLCSSPDFSRLILLPSNSNMTESLPKTYTAYAFTEKGGKLEKQTKDIRPVEAGEILIKTIATGVCHSDMVAQMDMFGGGLPRVPGHEIIGKVVAIPEGEKKWKVGQRVGSGWHGGHDGICGSCSKGSFTTCVAEQINGISRDGGYAEYVYLQTEAVAAIPESLDSVDAAPILCAGVTVFNSMRNIAGLSPGDLVAVQGIGGLGHLGIQFAHAAGYSVAALSTSEDKRQLAKDLHADHYLVGHSEEHVKKLQELGGAKLIMVTAPSAKLVSPLLDGLAVDGTLLILGLQEEPIPFNTATMITKRLSVKGWPSGSAADSEDTCQLAALRGIKVMTHSYPLDKCNEAYEDMMAGKPRFRNVLTFE